MTRRLTVRVLGVLALALLFGMTASVLKGNGAGVRDGIGNLSAPWVIVPLLAGAAAPRRRLGWGALLGLFATLLALTGFYLANAFVLDLGQHSSAADIALTLNVGSLWFKAGALSGPVMGALGAWASRRGRLTVAVIGALIVLLEPLVVDAYLHVRQFSGFAAGGGSWTGVYVGEGVAGMAMVAALLALIAWRRGHLKRP